MMFDSPLLSYCFILIMAFGIAYFAMPSIILLARKKRLFDEPDDFRKLHLTKTPNLGGIGIFSAFAFVACLVNSDKILPSWNFVFASLLILFATGLKDDIIGLSPVKKFSAQFLAAFILVYFGNIRITDLHGILGIHALPYGISLLFTIVGCIFVTNAFNLIDGIDGLAGGIGLLVFSIYGAYFASISHLGLAYVSFAMVGALLAFLRFNISPARIFMGDTGSLLLGFTAAVLSIEFVETNGSLSPASNAGGSAMLVALAILIIPVFDTFRVFINRLSRRRSPFIADRNHIHHLLLDLGLSHSQSAVILVSVNIIFITIAYCLKNVDPNIAICTTLLIAIGLFRVPLWLKSQKVRIAEEASLPAMLPVGSQSASEAIPVLPPKKEEPAMSVVEG